MKIEVDEIEKEQIDWDKVQLLTNGEDIVLALGYYYRSTFSGVYLTKDIVFDGKIDKKDFELFKGNITLSND